MIQCAIQVGRMKGDMCYIDHTGRKIFTRMLKHKPNTKWRVTALISICADQERYNTQTLSTLFQLVMKCLSPKLHTHWSEPMRASSAWRARIKSISAWTRPALWLLPFARHLHRAHSCPINFPLNYTSLNTGFLPTYWFWQCRFLSSLSEAQNSN